ncbi:MAG TPA: hypothetical protein VIM85_00580 [Pseudomonadales bacterium]
MSMQRIVVKISEIMTLELISAMPKQAFFSKNSFALYKFALHKWEGSAIFAHDQDHKAQNNWPFTDHNPGLQAQQHLWFSPSCCLLTLKCPATSIMQAAVGPYGSGFRFESALFTVIMLLS